ncbi:MAG: hypothetical protein JRI90_19015, partial [Deltaproteobacteria bacterium]|nr:hypothetical protein [Deltaproteobacteria bacterium]
QCPVQRFAPLIAVHVASALEHQANNEEQIDYSEELDTEHLNRLELADRLDPWKEACNEIFQ